MEILTKENLVGAKAAPTAISKTFTPLAREKGFLGKDSLFLEKVNRGFPNLGVSHFFFGKGPDCVADPRDCSS